MKWNTKLLHIVFVVPITLLFLVHSVKSHTAVSINPRNLHSIYALDNSMTDLLYHLDTGIVYKHDKEGLRSMYTHAHIMHKQFSPQGTVLGYIHKTENGSASHRYYVYVEPNKLKNMP